MRASPYDLTGYGFAPIAVETPTGRAEYVRGQQDVADRARPCASTCRGGAAGCSRSPGVGDPDDLDPAYTPAIADYLCSLASNSGNECAVVPRNGGHDFGTAAKVFSAALPWLAGRHGTPTTAAVTLPSAAAVP